MTYGEKLPWELIEEILSHLPPKFLVRFRAVSKQWNRLFEDKTFIRSHKNKMTPQFILTTQSKIYSVSINPKVEVRELVLHIPGLESQRLRYLVGHNDLLLCCTEKGAVIWNPWLKQTRWIGEANYSNTFEGIGYNDKSYMVLGYGPQKEDPTVIVWKNYDFASGAWKDHNPGSSNGNNGCSSQIFISGSVSLTGNLYWVGYDDTTGEGWCITQYYSSEGTFYDFCDLPCVTNHRFDAFVLAVFKGDRFSLLKQYHATKNIEVWVTKNKINGQSGGDVEWIKFMEVSSPDLPVLRHLRYSQPGYFIQDKTLVVCFTENGRAWIYFLGENKLIRKAEIHHVDGPWNLQYTYTPNLVQVPLVQKEETELTGGFSLYEFCYAYIHWWF